MTTPNVTAPATAAAQADASAPATATPAAPRIPLSSIRVDTSAYYFAHGHEPRGRGSWAFYFNPQEEPWWAPGSLLYSKARQLALREAQKRGLYSFTVAT